MKKRLHIELCGKVQNVGFRYDARGKALQWGVLGWAKNCADGRVELMVEGDEYKLQSFLDWCGHYGSGAVEKVNSKWLDNKDEFTSFVTY